MLETLRSRSGHPVHKLNGRYLSSRQDPVHEAQKWMSGVSELAFQSEIIFLLGAGNAFCAVELSKRNPNTKIFIITSEAQLITFWLDYFSANKISLNAQFILVEQAEEFVSSAELTGSIDKTFYAVDSSSAQNENRLLFKQIKEYLNARSYLSYAKMTKKHSDLQQISSMALPSIGLISIKNMHDWATLSPDISPKTKNIISVLRELVK